MLRARLAGLLLAFLGFASAHAAVPVGGYKIQRVYPHDKAAFTEGLLYLEGDIIESTGQAGASGIRRVRLADGAVLQSAKAPAEVFGEGVVNWGDHFYSLTWQDEIGFDWDRKTFKSLSSFAYEGKGWALT